MLHLPTNVKAGTDEFYLLLIQKSLINVTPEGDIILYAPDSQSSDRKKACSEITLHIGSLGAASSPALAVRGVRRWARIQKLPIVLLSASHPHQLSKETRGQNSHLTLCAFFMAAEIKPQALKAH